MFAIGEKIIYPLHGVGIIENIEDAYYEIHILQGNVHIRVAEKNVHQLGIRYPLSEIDFQKELEQAKKVVLPQKGHWIQQYQENMERLKSGSIKEVASVVFAMEEKAKKKQLSSTESRLLHLGKQILQSEQQLIKQNEKKLKKNGKTERKSCKA